MFANALGVGVLAGADTLRIEHRPDEAVEVLASGSHGGVRGRGGARRRVAGSSFAAPVVTGIVALHLQRHPGAPAAGVHDLLSRLAVRSAP
ncbi:MAG TPA: S8 family serine peptidase [Longimicrobium sp.]